MQENTEKTYGTELIDVVQLLNNEYRGLEQLCANINEHVDRVINKDAFADYIHYVNYFTQEVRDFIKGRRVAYVPYIMELAEKNDMEHNCAQCSGNCDMQHLERLFELNKTIEKMLSASEYASTELAIIYDKELVKEDVQVLNSEVLRTNALLRKILKQEVLDLIPKVKEAQRSINARN